MREAIGAFYELQSEAHDARDVGRCSECGDGGTVFKFSTVRGARRRDHDGYFCSRECHDRFHGLLVR